MKDITVVVGAGGIGQAIARRVSQGRHILVANPSAPPRAGCSAAC